jgi:hypothetical protein
MHDLIGGGQILFHQHRRQREHVADIVEAVAHFVVRKVLRIVIHVHQVVNGISILFAIQAADGDPAGILLVAALGRRELAVDEFQNEIALIVARLRLLLRRHIAGFQLLGHFFPDLPVLGELRIVSVIGQIQIALMLLRVMAGEAVVLEHRLDMAGQRHRPLRRRRGVRSVRRPGIPAKNGEGRERGHDGRIWDLKGHQQRNSQTSQQHYNRDCLGALGVVCRKPRRDPVPMNR